MTLPIRCSPLQPLEPSMLHTSFGIMVLGFTAMRVLWRATHHKPSPLGWKRWSTHAAHGLPYLPIFCMPLSGWAHDSTWKAAASHPIYLYGVVSWLRIS